MTNVDQGTEFGTWTDPVSRFMYQESTQEILRLFGAGNIPCNVGDLGGGAGGLKQFIPNATTVDIDPTKKPDIVDNILKHDKRYELVVLRYVLHYLNDYEVIQLFNNIQADKILVIQFTNWDLRAKYGNSLNETKYFRTRPQLQALIPKSEHFYSAPFVVDKRFYLNRLRHDKGFSHEETIDAFII